MYRSVHMHMVTHFQPDSVERFMYN